MSNEFLEQQNPSDNFGNAPNPNSSSHDNPGINDHDDQNSNSNKRDDRDRGPPARFFYRFLFPSALTGLVVGKGGQLVKSLRDRYQCDIYIKETKGPERMMRFKADCAEDIANCMEEMASKWQENMQKLVPQIRENQSEIRLVVHRSQCGVIIGKKGEGIKEMRKKFNCLILMHSECLPRSQERICQIAGEPEQIKEALIEILNQINEIEVEFDTKEWYNPDNYDDHSDYGGYKSKSFNGRTSNSSRTDYGPPQPIMNPPLPGWTPPAGQPMPVTYNPVPHGYYAPVSTYAGQTYRAPPVQPVYQAPPVQHHGYTPAPVYGGTPAAYTTPQMMHPPNFGHPPNGAGSAYYPPAQTMGGYDGGIMKYERAGGPTRGRSGHGSSDSKPDYFRR